MRSEVFSGASVFLSRSLVPPEAYDAVHDALRLNGATVFLCCDPSHNSASDFHVISSIDHEKFEYLRSKGCNLLGPQCVLFCAKENRTLPKQGYTCCLAMDGVKVLGSGFEKDEKAKIEQLVTGMGGTLLSKASPDADFVVVKNVLAAKYKWALNVLKKPILNTNWLYQCWTEHRIVPQEPHKIPPFSGLTICVTKIPADERKQMEKLIVEHGGYYSADLTKKCTHLVSDTAEGDKFMVARRWGHIHIVSRRWLHQSIAKRACLDEGFYSVPEASISCNSMKTSQKEQHHQAQTSKPVVPTEFEDLETTISQNASSTFSDAAKVHYEKTEAPILQKKDEVEINSCIAEDSETEDNDLYLSDCRILLLGFNENEQAKLVNMIRKGGGSRHMLLSEKLTHAVLGTPSEIEKKELRRLAAWGVINVVKATWLEECDQAKREVSVSPRHIISELLLPKASTFCCSEPPSNHCSDKKGKNSMGTFHVKMGQSSQDKATETAVPSATRNGREKYENCTSSRTFTGLRTTSERSNHACSLKSSSDEIPKEQVDDGNVDSKKRSSNAFQGQSFCFSSSFPNDRRAEIIEWVTWGGGVMVDGQWQKNAHCIIESHGSVRVSAVVPQSIVVSPHWIRFCLEEGCMQDVGSHILFSPLRCKIPFPGFEGLRFCVSQYEEKERLLLRNLCHTLGAKFTEKLTKKVTHLLCKFTSGPKYEAASKWGIQSITAEWLTECIKQDMMVPLDPFQPKAVTAQDMEAGLCTVSQYPTQAARMVYGKASQLLSDSVVPTECQKAYTDSSQSMALMKKPRLSESDSRNASSKKNKKSEGLLEVPYALPDVADAIEDLLAQSNKMQDVVKSPGRSSCNQSSLPPQLSILGQDNPVSHSNIEIPRPWLSRTPSHENQPNLCGQSGKLGTYDSFSETQTESQVVGYEEDLSGRQKIIDRVRSQNATLTPDNMTDHKHNS